jgi:hypothetical protein
MNLRVSLAEGKRKQARAKQDDTGYGDSEKTIGSEFITHDVPLGVILSIGRS